MTSTVELSLPGCRRQPGVGEAFIDVMFDCPEGGAELLAGHLVPANSMFAFLAAHRAEVFPDAEYADLFAPGVRAAVAAGHGQDASPRFLRRAAACCRQAPRHAYPPF